MRTQSPKRSQPANDVDDVDACRCRVAADPTGSGVFLDVHPRCRRHGCTCGSPGTVHTSKCRMRQYHLAEHS